MRVLFVSANFRSDTVGGAQKSIELLAAGLRERGHATHVAKLSKDGTTRTWQHDGAIVHEFGRTNAYWPFDNRPRSPMHKVAFHALDLWNPLVARQLAALCRELRPDIVHTNVLAGISVSAWSAAVRCGVPVVHTLRDYYLLCVNSGMQRAGQPCVGVCGSCRLAKSGARWATGQCAAVVGNSDYILRRHLDAGYFAGTGRQRVIFTGAELPGAEVVPRQRPLVDDVLWLGFLGRLSPSKGIEPLIEAVNGLAGRVRLLVGGDGAPDYVAALHRRADPALVEFAGRTTPAAFYPRIDLLCVPSLWPEPLSRTIMEAYTYGLPVLASPAGGSPEVVIDGETGFVLDFRTPGALGAVLDRLAGAPDEYTRLAAGARAMGDSLGIGNTVAAYERLYLDLVAPSGVGEPGVKEERASTCG